MKPRTLRMKLKMLDRERTELEDELRRLASELGQLEELERRIRSALSGGGAGDASMEVDEGCGALWKIWEGERAELSRYLSATAGERIEVQARVEKLRSGLEALARKRRSLEVVLEKMEREEAARLRRRRERTFEEILGRIGRDPLN